MPTSFATETVARDGCPDESPSAAPKARPLIYYHDTSLHVRVWLDRSTNSTVSPTGACAIVGSSCCIAGSARQATPPIRAPDRSRILSLSKL